MARSTVRATLLVVLSACCFGSVSPLTVLALKSGAALQGIQAWRYTTTALLLLAWGWYVDGARARVSRAEAATSVLASDNSLTARAAPWYSWRVLLIAGGGQTLVATLALMALLWIPAATEAFLFYTFPAWVAVLSALRGVERLDAIRVSALGLALGGIAFMVGAPSAGSLHPIGVTLALTAALVYAVYIPVLNGLQRDRPALDVSRAIAVGGSLIFMVWAIVTGALFEHFTTIAFISSVLQGVVSAVAFLAFLAGLATLGPVRTAITSTVEPFWTTMLGVFMLSQPIGGGTLVGGAAIMGAVVLLQRTPSAKAAPTSLHST